LSLVVAFAGEKKAIAGGDKRSIAFFGEAETLEEELYSGAIQTDDQLAARTKDLGAKLAVSDGKEKVWRSGDVLVGEVTEISAEKQRRRRVYVTCGGYILAEISGKEAIITKKGKSTLIILGNRFTQKLAYGLLATGKVPDRSSVEAAFQEVGRKTASVSKEHTILLADKLWPNPQSLLVQAFCRDCEEMGWKTSGLR